MRSIYVLVLGYVLLIGGFAVYALGAWGFVSESSMVDECTAVCVKAVRGANAQHNSVQTDSDSRIVSNQMAKLAIHYQLGFLFSIPFAVMMLVGPNASYITGSTLMLDGGQAFLR